MIRAAGKKLLLYLPPSVHCQCSAALNKPCDNWGHISTNGMTLFLHRTVIEKGGSSCGTIFKKHLGEPYVAQFRRHLFSESLWATIKHNLGWTRAIQPNENFFLKTLLGVRSGKYSAGQNLKCENNGQSKLFVLFFFRILPIRPLQLFDVVKIQIHKVYQLRWSLLHASHHTYRSKSPYSVSLQSAFNIRWSFDEYTQTARGYSDCTRPRS